MGHVTHTVVCEQHLVDYVIALHADFDEIGLMSFKAHQYLTRPFLYITLTYIWSLMTHYDRKSKCPYFTTKFNTDISWACSADNTKSRMFAFFALQHQKMTFCKAVVTICCVCSKFMGCFRNRS